MIQRQTRLLILVSLLIAAAALLLLTYSRQENLSTAALMSTVEVERSWNLIHMNGLAGGQDSANILRTQAEQQSRIARARELAANSINALDRDPELSLLLAIESVNVTYKSDRSYTDESYLALQKALSSRLVAVFRKWPALGLKGIIFSENSFRIILFGDAGAMLLDGDGNFLSDLNSSTELITVAEFSPDQTQILTAGCVRDGNLCVGGGGAAHVWNWKGEIESTLDGHGANIDSAHFSPDGKTIVTASSDGLIQMWDNRGTLVYSIKLPAGNARSINAYFSRDGSTFLVTGPNSKIRVFAVLDGTLIKTIDGTLVSHDSQKEYLNNYGGRLIVKEPSGRLVLYDNNWDLISALDVAPESSGVVLYSFDFSRVLVRNIDLGEVYVFNTENGELLATITGHRLVEWVNMGSGRLGFLTRECELYAPNECSGSWTTKVTLWDSNGEIVKVYDKTASVRFSPDGNRTIVTGTDGLARLYNSDGELIAFFNTLAGGLFPFLEFSPTSQFVIRNSCEVHNYSTDNCAEDYTQLWDAGTGALIARYPNGGDPRGAIFSPNSERYLTFDFEGFEGAVRLWATSGMWTDPRLIDGPIDIMLSEAKRRTARTLTDDECRQYLYLDRCQPVME